MPTESPTTTDPAIESHRAHREEALAAIVAAILAHAQQQLIALLGTPPKLTNIPAAFWDDLTAQLRTAITSELTETATLSAHLQASEFGISFPVGLQSTASTWANRHAEQLVEEFIANTKQFAADAVAKWEAEHADDKKRDLEKLLLALALIFGVDRAIRLAITETTGAIVAGGDAAAGAVFQASGGRGSLQAAIDEIIRSRRFELREIEPGQLIIPQGAGGDGAALMEPVVLVAVWAIDPLSERLCDVCDGLNGKPEYEWPEEYAAGPPSPHPNCRCRIRYQQLVRAKASE